MRSNFSSNGPDCGVRWCLRQRKTPKVVPQLHQSLPATKISPQVVIYVSFSADSRQCPVLTLREYERKTSAFRRPEDKNPLFLSYQKPSVTAATIARWLKTALSQAGIDTTVFRAHSTRAASISAAVLVGASMKDIMDSAGWTRESTFENFYHKPVVRPAMGGSVLGSTHHLSKFVLTWGL